MKYKNFFKKAGTEVKINPVNSIHSLPTYLQLSACRILFLFFGTTRDWAKNLMHAMVKPPTTVFLPFALYLLTTNQL